MMFYSNQTIVNGSKSHSPMFLYDFPVRDNNNNVSKTVASSKLSSHLNRDMCNETITLTMNCHHPLGNDHPFWFSPLNFIFINVSQPSFVKRDSLRFPIKLVSRLYRSCSSDSINFTIVKGPPNEYASVVGRTTYMVHKERKIKVEKHSLKDIYTYAVLAHSLLQACTLYYR